VFQDLSLGQTIANVKEKNGLYILNDVGSTSNIQSPENISLLVSSHLEIMLWHKCLGYPSFVNLKSLYPKLFSNKDPFLF